MGGGAMTYFYLFLFLFLHFFKFSTLNMHYWYNRERILFKKIFSGALGGNWKYWQRWIWEIIQEFYLAVFFLFLFTSENWKVIIFKSQAMWPCTAHFTHSSDSVNDFVLGPIWEKRKILLVTFYWMLTMYWALG